MRLGAFAAVHRAAIGTIRRLERYIDKPCGRSSMARTSAFQADDVGSTPIVRSQILNSSAPVLRELHRPGAAVEKVAQPSGATVIVSAWLLGHRQKEERRSEGLRQRLLGPGRGRQAVSVQEDW